MSSVTILPGTTGLDQNINVAAGTRVLLDDGRELENVISIKLEAEAGGIWLATIVCHPKEVRITKAVAERIVYKQHDIDKISSHIDEQGKITLQADVTSLADGFSRKFKNVEVD